MQRFYNFLHERLRSNPQPRTGVAFLNERMDEFFREKTGILSWRGKEYKVTWHSNHFELECEGAGIKDRHALASALEELRISASKRTPYSPSEDAEKVQFNYVVKFGVGREGGDDDIIACRHLVIAWGNLFFGSDKGKPDYTRLNTAEAIKLNVPRWTQLAFVAARQYAPIHIVARQTLGQALISFFEAMHERNETTSIVLTQTINHAMAVGLKIKRISSRRIFVVLFYDPTATASHRRAKFDNLKDMALLPEGAFDPVGQSVGPDAFLMIPITPEVFERLLRVKTAPLPRPKPLSSSVPPISPVAVRHLLELDCIEALEAITPAFGMQAMELRAATLLPDADISPVYRMMALGHPGTLKMLKPLMLGLTLECRMDILRGREPKGIPALAVALLRDRPDMIEPYWSLVKECAPEEWYYNLMRGTCPDSMPVLSHLAAQGHVAMFEAYLRAVDDMAPQLLAQLLCDMGRDSKLGLVWAVQLGRVEMVKAFDKALSRIGADLAQPLLTLATRQLDQHRVRDFSAQREATAALCEIVRTYAPALESGCASFRGKFGDATLGAQAPT